VSVCSSSAPQLALDLTKIDPELPDDRAMILEEPPAYALHRWDGRHLVSHFDTVDDHPPLASYDAGMQDVVRHLMAEKSP
jgi:hypothetical protein